MAAALTLASAAQAASLPQAPANPSSVEECSAYESQAQSALDQITQAKKACTDREDAEFSRDYLADREGWYSRHACTRNCRYQAACGVVVYVIFEACRSLYEARDCAQQQLSQSSRQCRQQANDNRREQEEKAAAERERIAMEGEERRDAQRASYDSAGQASRTREGIYDSKRETAEARAGVFGSAAERNRAALERGGSYSGGGGPVSVDSVMGGGLRDVLGSLRAMTGTSSQGSDSGSASLLPTFLPSSGSLGNAAAVFDRAGWPGAAALGAAAEYVGQLEAFNEKAKPYLELWNSVRSGDTVAASGQGSVMAAEALLPEHASFFAVPALKATTATHQQVLGQFDQMMAQTDHLSYSGSSVNSSYAPSTGSGDGPAIEYPKVQQYYVEAMCDQCQYDEESRSWRIGSEQVLIVGEEGDLSVGWGPVEIASSR